jgi:hypothetical protein
MAENVRVPGIGATDKKWVYGGAALLVGVVGYAYWSRSRNTPAVEPINPDATPEDRVPFTDSQVSSGATDSFTAGHPTTAADWASMATDRLVELGRDATLVASALGKYITHVPLTAAEQDIVRSAIGQFGLPPGDTYPILSAPPPPASTGGGTSPPPATTISRPAKVTGLHIHKRTAKTIELGWARASGAVAYAVNRNGKRINIVLVPGASVGSIHASYTIQGINVRGYYGPASNPLSV